MLSILVSVVSNHPTVTTITKPRMRRLNVSHYPPAKRVRTEIPCERTASPFSSTLRHSCTVRFPGSLDLQPRYEDDKFADVPDLRPLFEPDGQLEMAMVR